MIRMAMLVVLLAGFSLTAGAVDDVVIVKFDASKVTGIAYMNSNYPYAADVTYDSKRNAKASIVKQSDGSLVSGTFTSPQVFNTPATGGAQVEGVNGLFQNGYHTAEIAWQYTFSTIGFVSATVNLSMAAKAAATKGWKAQVSVDGGTTFADLGEAWSLTEAGVKVDKSFTLPATAVGKEQVVIRFMGTIAGETTALTDLIGTYEALPFTTAEGALSTCEHSETQLMVTVLGTREPDVTLSAVPPQSYMTYCSDKRLMLHTDMPTGVKLYTITGVTGTAVNTAEVTVVEANTPMLIYNGKEAALDVKLSTTIEDATEVTAFSGFKGTTAGKAMPASSESMSYYICNGKAFAKVSEAGTVAANRCWLEVAADKGASARQLAIGGEGETTGVEGIRRGETATGDEVWYDLQGRRVAAAGKGVYIVKGKKVVMK